MTKLIETETDPTMSEAIFTSISTLIKAENFDGKRRYIKDFDGLGQLTRLLLSDCSIRYRRKQLSLLVDLLMFDQYIIPENKLHTRQYFGGNGDVVEKLLEIVDTTGFDVYPEIQVRELALKCLFYIYQVHGKELAHIVEPLTEHLLRLE